MQPQGDPNQQSYGPAPSQPAKHMAHGQGYDWARQAYIASHLPEQTQAAQQISPPAYQPTPFLQSQQPQFAPAYSFPDINPQLTRKRSISSYLIISMAALACTVLLAFVVVTMLRSSPYDGARAEFSALEDLIEGSTLEQTQTYFYQVYLKDGQGLSTSRAQVEQRDLNTILGFIHSAYTDESGDDTSRLEVINALGPTGDRITIMTKQLRFDESSAFMTVAYEQQSNGGWLLTRIRLWSRLPADSEKLTLARGDYGIDAVPGRLQKDSTEVLQTGDPNADEFDL